MKVRDLISVSKKLMPILEYYQDRTVDYMLEDIYKNCCSTSEVDKNPSREQKAKSERLSLDDAVAIIPGMEKGKRTYLLNDYTIPLLKEIARRLNIKIKSKMIKAEIIETIVSLAGTNLLEAQEGGNIIKADGSDADRLADATTKISQIGKEEIIDFLKSYNKSEILEIARRLNLSISASNRKDEIVQLIANHFGYIDLNKRLAERPKGDGMF